MDCVLCREDGGEVLWSDDALRVVLADEPDWPGLCRVIWGAPVSPKCPICRTATACA